MFRKLNYIFGVSYPMVSPKKNTFTTKFIFKSTTLAITFSLISATTNAWNGPAFTGLVAKADDAGTAFSNPAGLTRLPRNQILGSPMIVRTSSKFKVDAATYEGGDSVQDDAYILVPNFSWSIPIAEDFWFGLTVNAPGGIGGNFGQSWSGRYQDRNSSLAFVAVTPVIAYKINDSFSIGGGFSAMLTESTTEVSINNGPLYDDGKMRLEENGVSFTYTASAMWEINKQQRAAITYRSESEPDVDGVPEFKDMSPLVNEVLAQKGVLGQRVKVDLRIPQMVFAGYYQEISPKWAYSIDAVWVDFSRFGLQHFTVGDTLIESEPQYEDIFMGMIGGFYQWNDKLNVSAGLIYITSGVEDENRGFQIPLDDTFGIGVGFEKAVSLDKIYHLNLTYFSSNDGPINSGDDPIVGNVQGSFENRNAIFLEFGATILF